jgi:hypothetical protein
MGQGKTVGVVLIVVALLLVAVTGMFLVSGVTEGRLRASGFLLGLGLALVLALPLLGVGTLMIVRGRGEERQLGEVEKEKKILNIVSTHGQVNVGEVAVEMNLTRDQVRNYVYDLVGKELFTGYINWGDGILYARQAADMRTTKCPNCGGVRQVVGKGVVQCPYCGVDLFL